MSKKVRTKKVSKNVARLLLANSKQDARAAALLMDTDPAMVGDPIFGFHIQQAVEKASKALIAWKGEEYEFTHSITDLFEALARAGEPVPGRYSKLEGLTPFAESVRYETAVPHQIERRGFMDLTNGFLEWIDSYFQGE